MISLLRIQNNEYTQVRLRSKYKAKHANLNKILLKQNFFRHVHPLVTFTNTATFVYEYKESMIEYIIKFFNNVLFFQSNQYQQFKSICNVFLK